jgi:hypothetical protein
MFKCDRRERTGQHNKTTYLIIKSIPLLSLFYVTLLLRMKFKMLRFCYAFFRRIAFSVHIFADKQTKNSNDMNKKNIVLMLAAAIISLPLFASGQDIYVRIKPGQGTGSRTIIVDTVTASIDGQVLTALFSDVTASSILVYEESNPDTVLFSQNYTPAYSAQADLTSLPAGNYVVEIYAFGVWWLGYFDIE